MPALRVTVVATVVASILSSCAGIPGGDGPTGITTSPAPAKLFADDFKPVCQGATVSRATSYAEATTSHKAILFSPNDGTPYEDTSTLPADWMVQFDANSDAYQKVDTVVCVDVESEQLIKECSGYTRDDHETDNKVTLNTAKYRVDVHEATTGRLLGSTELDGTDDACPMFMTFDDDSQHKTYDAPPAKDDLIAFVKPFVQP